ncbi:SDR family oxidoreductase [Stenotrophomonas sp. 24(2023)]|uniref:SDR family oxidoreductase n=1 Tax=Stenotrophomonas sp. 24(2023) TaxID=3068324 RepID=UPI0027E1CD4E|nr:SDR family oxidoreductase [Stenotrophomonas sp. 24(2023)]WMJ70555.1 SDR family oxidoreductase [Stenotrophomonas sp. 24(2023)]
MTAVPGIAAWPATPLDGKVVLVTGGANGVGRGIAQAVLGAGGRVVIGDLDVEAGNACLADWQRGQDAVFERLDIADEDSVRAFIDVALQRFGRLDGLVNNAGIAAPHGTPLAQMTIDEWQRRLSSLHGAFLCSKHALPALIDSGAGAIINVASTRARQSEPDSEAYAAAKGGLLAFTHALAISAGPVVRVNSISPGWISTAAWQAPSRRRTPALSATDHAQHPVGRVGQPEDIGALAVYLLSSLSGFTTGQDFVVDGGMTRKMIYAE